MTRKAKILDGVVDTISLTGTIENGWVEVPNNVFAGFIQNKDGTFSPPPVEKPTIEELRANATMPKDDFILAALDAGVLSEADAEEATNGWPTSFNDFFEGQPARERIEAKARWANATNVYRNAPLIEALAAFKGLSPEQVDALFGVGALKDADQISLDYDDDKHWL